MTDLAKLEALIAEHVHYSNAANMRAASALIPDLIKATYEAITGTPYNEALAASGVEMPNTGDVPTPAPIAAQSAAESIVAETPAPVVEVPVPVAEDVAQVDEPTETAEDAPSGDEAKGRKPRAK